MMSRVAPIWAPALWVSLYALLSSPALGRRRHRWRVTGDDDDDYDGGSGRAEGGPRTTKASSHLFVFRLPGA